MRDGCSRHEGQRVIARTNVCLVRQFVRNARFAALHEVHDIGEATSRCRADWCYLRPMRSSAPRNGCSQVLEPYPQCYREVTLQVIEVLVSCSRLFFCGYPGFAEFEHNPFIRKSRIFRPTPPQIGSVVRLWAPRWALQHPPALRAVPPLRARACVWVPTLRSWQLQSWSRAYRWP